MNRNLCNFITFVEAQHPKKYGLKNYDEILTKNKTRFY